MTSSLATPVGGAQGLSNINNALKYISEWCGQNGLTLSPNKCVHCTFPLKGNAVTDPDLKATINDNAFSTVDAKWTNHVEGIFRKCVRLSFFCKEISKVINTCWGYSQICRGVMPIILYCSLAIFPGHHIKASSNFAARILAGSEHPLHAELSKASSHTSTRSRF